ncbi:ankyrin repeat domain-containing protein 13C-A-like isoform X2 [Ornithodoros turicata]
MSQVPSTTATEGNEAFPLHKAVFENDYALFSALLPNHNIAEKDVHGNTPLHLAVMLGRNDFIEALLTHNAPVNARNLNGWSCLHEAVSFGGRQTVRALLEKGNEQVRQEWEARKPQVKQVFERIGSFCTELHWDVRSWVPVISSLLPSDILKIYKKGLDFRVDLTLVDFQNLQWVRGSITVLVTVSFKANENKIRLLDNKRKVYQFVRKPDHIARQSLDDDVDELMSNDIEVAQFQTDSVVFEPIQVGWVTRGTRREHVGRYEADFYLAKGLSDKLKVRQEHLSEDDIRRNNQLRGTAPANTTAPQAETIESMERQRRESLAPPPPSNVTYRDYIGAPPGAPPVLGRPLVQRCSTKAFKPSTFALSDQFPVTVNELLGLLEGLINPGPLQKIHDFVLRKLPRGFPVKLEVPVLPTVFLTLALPIFEFRETMEDSLFEVPEGYQEVTDVIPGDVLSSV